MWRTEIVEDVVMPWSDSIFEVRILTPRHYPPNVRSRYSSLKGDRWLDSGPWPTRRFSCISRSPNLGHCDLQVGSRAFPDFQTRAIGLQGVFMPLISPDSYLGLRDSHACRSLNSGSSHHEGSGVLQISRLRLRPSWEVLIPP